MPPLISIVIPVYNHTAYLQAAVDSVVGNGYKNFEIIIVDDGSKEPVPVLGHTLLRQENAGLSAARNAGLKQAHGEFVLFLDADDRLNEGALEALHGALLANPTADIAQGAIERIHVGGSNDRWLSTQPFYAVNVPANLFRTARLRELGGFDEAFRYAEDSEFFVRAWHAYVEKVRIPETVLWYQLHDANMTSNPPSNKAQLLQLMRHHAKRKKAGIPMREGSGLIEYLGWDSENQARPKTS